MAGDLLFQNSIADQIRKRAQNAGNTVPVESLARAMPMAPAATGGPAGTSLTDRWKMEAQHQKDLETQRKLQQLLQMEMMRRQ